MAAKLERRRGPKRQGRERRRTLQGKLITLVVSSVGLAVLLVTAASALKDGKRAAQLESGRLAAAAQVLASMSADAVDSGDAARGYEALRAISHMPGVVYGRIERADGAPLVETGSGARLIRDTDGASGSWLSALSSRSTRASAPITRQHRTVGRVVLLSKSEGVAGRLLASLLVSLLASAVATLAGLAIAWRLQRRIAAPVTALTAAMTQVQQNHDYAGSVHVRADDEVGQLVDGFNAMLAQIRARDERIAEHVEGLEGEVAARTAELEVAKTVAEDANRAKSDFLAAMSHEIRTPMNGVMVMAEMLATSDLPSKPRRFAEVIAKSGAGLISIINDILDVSKIEAGKLELETGEIDLAETIEDVMSLFWDRAANKGLDLACFVDPKVPRLVAGDPTRLRQVVTNLVNNAVKFTESGGVLVEVEPRGDGVVRICVRDTGVGIADDKIAGLFDAFSQADQSTTRKFGGTGLGLNICKRLVDAMGGTFAVTSRLGQGSCFAFDLPAATRAEAIPVAPAPEGVLVRIALAGPSTRRALQRHLQAWGARTRNDEATTLVFTDPSAAATPGAAPVVCLSAYADPEGPRRLAEGRAQALLMQPFRRSDLYAIFAQLAEGRPIASPQEAGRAAAASHPTFSTARVLVADDSAVNREVAVEALARLGIAPQVVEDGREAVDAVLARPNGAPFDLILMDGSMPVLDGYDAAREIRALGDDRGRTPILALTAHVLGPAAEAWRAVGMDGALHKPFTLADLVAAVSPFLTADAVATPLHPPTEASAPFDAVPGRAWPVAALHLIDPEAVEQLEALASGAPAGFIDRVRRLYAENAPACVSAVAKAAAAGDGPGVATAAHALKSMSHNVGAARLAAMAAAAEAAGREGAVPTPEEIAALEDTFDRTLAALAPEAAAQRGKDAALAQELVEALDAGEGLALVYQPQFDRTGREIVGVEALMRWPRPGRDPVDPERLARLAERHGLIGRLTDWVARRAMVEMADIPALKVAVNGSALDFADPDFPARIALALAETGFDPGRFEIEITETAMVSDEAACCAVMEELRAQGIGIALDDFGAGYSSLRYLRSFPFGKLKIDRQFITDCQTSVQSATIVHAVVSIGRALGMKVVAEGVETQAECDFLRSAGVHAFQGYLFCKPVSASKLARILAEQPSRAAA